MNPLNPLASTIATATADPLVDPNHPVLTGQVLDGKFRVERIIGEGAMGLVVEATHLALDERVALKFLRREARARPDIIARFAREARAAVKIKSDHVARVFDVGGTEDGTPFIVMELLEGNDLEQLLLKRGGPLEISEAVEYVIQACEGLSAAHARSIIHRDIKPANLFIAESGGARQVKVLDFGISKAGITTDEVDPSAPTTSQIMGSPYYMSPEQMRSTKNVDTRADIWSLGVVLFELLTAQTPFNATEVVGIISQVLYEAHRSARGLRSELPIEIEHIIDKCLSKEVTLRYQTAAELAVALVPFAPKRSRAVAERASRIALSSAGSTSGDLPPDSLPPSAQFGPTTVPIPTTQQSPITQPSPGAPGSGPGPGSGSGSGSASGFGPTGTVALSHSPVPSSHSHQTNPSLVGAGVGVRSDLAIAVPSHAPPRSAGSVVLYLACAAALVGLAGGIFALVARFRPPPVAVGSESIPSATPLPLPSTATTPLPSAPTTAAETASAAAASAAAASAAASSTAPEPVQSTHAPVVATAPRRPVPSASASARPTPNAIPESDIRLER